MLACAGTGAGGQMALAVPLASVGPRCQPPSPRAGLLSRCGGSFQRVEAHHSSVPHVSGHSIVRRSAPAVCRAATSTAAQEESAMIARSQTSSVLAMILGGGAGSRLYPLTNSRAKPAVPIGGAYRLIDVPMSNCLNSGITKIYILTQFNSTSLNRHLARTYNLGASGVRFGGEAFVEVLAASQTPKEKAWFQGTADAVRQYMWLLEDVRHREVEDVIVLSGDHLYRMDYMQFVDAHRQSGADISIGCLPVDEHRASDFGLMQIDDSGRVRSFSEKPKGEALEYMKVDTTVLGLDAAAARRTPYIASMGIYVFKRHVMAELLRDYDSCNDFGGEIIPAAAKERHVQAYLFNGYWEDIGTIESFFHANISLCANPPNFEFHDPRGPIYTSPRFLPPAKIEDCLLHDAVVSHGAVLARCEVRNAIVGLRSRVEEGVVVQNALVMGADYYESDARRAALRAKGEVPLGIGRGSRLDQVVLDKNARVGENVVIANRDGVQEASREEQGIYIRSGIVVVARNTTIPSGTVI